MCLSNPLKPGQNTAILMNEAFWDNYYTTTTIYCVYYKVILVLFSNLEIFRYWNKIGKNKNDMKGGKRF